MGGSAGVAVKKAVIAGLTTHFQGLAEFNSSTPENEVLVEYGYGFGEHAAQRVYTGRSRGDTPPAAMRSGRNHRQETGRFDLIVLVTLPGGDVEDAEDRADAIAAQVETWVADRKQGDGLGVTGLYELYVESWEGDYRGADRARTVIRRLTVLWRARLT